MRWCFHSLVPALGMGDILAMFTIPPVPYNGSGRWSKMLTSALSAPIFFGSEIRMKMPLFVVWSAQNSALIWKSL